MYHKIYSQIISFWKNIQRIWNRDIKFVYYYYQHPRNASIRFSRNSGAKQRRTEATNTNTIQNYKWSAFTSTNTTQFPTYIYTSLSIIRHIHIKQIIHHRQTISYTYRWWERTLNTSNHTLMIPKGYWSTTPSTTLTLATTLTTPIKDTPTRVPNTTQADISWHYICIFKTLQQHNLKHQTITKLRSIANNLYLGHNYHPCTTTKFKEEIEVLNIITYKTT